MTKSRGKVVMITGSVGTVQVTTAAGTIYPFVASEKVIAMRPGSEVCFDIEGPPEKAMAVNLEPVVPNAD